MTDRKQEIETSIDELIAVHDAWSSDENSSEQPPEELGLFIERAALICEDGDLPAECLDLHLAVAKLALEWKKFTEEHNHRVYRTPEGDTLYLPLSSLWAAMRQLIHHRQTVTIAARRRIEPVKELIEQKLNPEQIARIYGERAPVPGSTDSEGVWQGPFFLDNGQPDVHKIREEAEKPGTHIGPDWQHPSEKRKLADTRIEIERRIQLLRDREDRDNPAENNPASDQDRAIQMGREECSVEQISNCCKLTSSEVVELLESNDIEPVWHADIMNKRAAFEPDETDQDKAYGNSSKPEKPKAKPAAVEVTPEKADQIYRLLDEGKKPGEIGKIVGLTTFKVNKIIRSRETAETNEQA